MLNKLKASASQTEGLKPFLISLILYFASTASIILSKTYIDLLFLSTYPRSWIPYFFIGQSVVIVILAVSITPLIAKGSRIINFSILVFFCATNLISRFLLGYNIKGFPFILSLWLAVQAILLSVIAWNAIGDAFDMRKFKKIAKWVNTAGSLGGLIIGVSVPLIILKYGSESLMYILALFIVISALGVLNLKPLPVTRKKSKRGQKPLKYPLFRYLAIATLLVLAIDTFSDYALKSELQGAFTKDQIGKFMGPFYGISSVLSMIVQFGGTGLLLKFLGIAGLLLVVPGFCLLANIGMVFFPLFWFAVIFRLGHNVFRYSFDNLGRQISANPLPAQVRRTGKLFLKSVASPVGKGIAAVLLLVIAERFGLRGVAIATILVCSGSLYIIKKISKSYHNTLEEAVRIKRFGEAADDAPESTIQAARIVAFNALQRKERDDILFGLLLLEDVLTEDKLPPQALRHIDSEFPIIRATVAKTAGKLKDINSVPHLIKRLETERDTEVRWRLLEAISFIKPESAVSMAAELLDSPEPEVRAGAILILIKAGDLDALISAGSVLREMMKNPDHNMRKGAARALGALTAGKLEKELRVLIEDPDEEVAIAAIRSAGAQKAVGLSDILASRLKHGRISHYAARTLVGFGVPVIPYLKKTIKDGKYISIRTAIRILSLIPDQHIEDAMIEIAKSGDVMTRSIIARESAMRARRQSVSNDFKENARRFVIEEAKTIDIFKPVSKSDSLSDYVKSEISARQKLAETRLLNWFAVCTNPAEVIDTIPAIIPATSSKTTASRCATAIELLDTLATDGELKKAVTAFEDKTSYSPDEALNLIDSIDDPWLKRVLQTKYTGGDMDITQKVMILRKTRLFEHLPGEILLTIAEVCENRDVAEGEKIFSEGDSPDGVYIVASGFVNIIKNSQVIAELGEHDFFGEVGLLDDAPRMADAVAKTDGMLLYVDRETFDSITEDLPEVLRAVIKTVIGYLKHKKQ